MARSGEPADRGGDDEQETRRILDRIKRENRELLERLSKL